MSHMLRHGRISSLFCPDFSTVFLRRAGVVLAASLWLALSVSPARATITVLDDWQLGEADPGAVAGGTPTNLVDSVGGHNLKVVGSALYSTNVAAAAALNTGSSLSVNFTNSAYATNPANVVISTLTTNFGIEAWVYPPTVSGSSGGWIIAYNGNTGGNGWGFILQNNDYEGLLGDVTYVGATPATAGVWTHLALVNNNGVNTFYTNGVAAGASTTNTANVSTESFGIATTPGAPGSQVFPGLVDEVRIFTFASGQFSTNDLLINENPGSVGTTNLLMSPAGGANSITLSDTSPWSAGTAATWLHISAGYQSGINSTNVLFSCDTNTGAIRTGTLTIAGQTVTVTQAGTGYVAAVEYTNLAVGSILDQPTGVAVDGSGNVYIANSDDNNPSVEEWVAASGTIMTLLNSASGLSSTPEQLALDGMGDIYIAGGYEIQEWVASTNTLVTLVPSTSGIDPYTLAVDGSGDVFFPSIATSPAPLDEWVAASNKVVTLAGGATEGPEQVAVDAAENVYIADADAGVLDKYNPFSGSKVPLVSGVNSLFGVTVDGSGNVFYSDYNPSPGTWEVREWSATTEATSLVATTGQQPAEGLAVDGSGNIYQASPSSTPSLSAIGETERALVNTAAHSEGAAAGTDTLSPVLPVTANLSGSFAPTTDSAWLTINGVNNGVVNFSFASNSSGAVRTGHINVLGQSIPITQGIPSYIVGTTNVVMSTAAGTNSVVLGTIPPGLGLPWTAATNATWLHLASGFVGGTAGTNVIFTCDANPGATRTGTLTIAGQTVTVTQAGTNYVAATMFVTLASGLAQPEGVAVDGSGNVYIANTQGGNILEWSVVSNTVFPLISGLSYPEYVTADASDNVYYFSQPELNEFVAASNEVIGVFGSYNIDPADVVLDVSGNVYFEDYSGAIEEWVAASGNINSLVPIAGSPESLAVDAGGNIYYDVNSGVNIEKWTPSGGPSALTASLFSFTEGLAVDGSGNVYLMNGGNNDIVEWSAATGSTNILLNLSAYSANSSSIAVDKQGNFYFADFSASKADEFARALVNPTVRLESSSAGSDSLPAVLPTAENLTGPFAPKSDSSWLTITGITNGVVGFSFTADAGPGRTGHISLLGQTIPIAQGTPSYAVGTTNLLLGPAAGSNTVVLGTTPASIPWTASTNATWLHLSPVDQSGYGSTNLVFTYDANPGATRTGTLTIAGQTVAITQAGSTYVAAGALTNLVASGLAGPRALSEGVAVDGSGNVYFTDSGNNAIKEWVLTNNSVVTLVSSGLSDPQGIALDGAGDVYFADTGNNAIKEWVAVSDTVVTIWSSGLGQPRGVALDGAGNVYIANAASNSFAEWVAASNILVTLASVDTPSDLARDAAGNLYADYYPSSYEEEWSPVGGFSLPITSGLNHSLGLAVDGSGNIYSAAYSTSGKIIKWLASSRTVTTLASSGLSDPEGVAVDNAGNVYVTDPGHGAVKELPHAFVDPTAKSESLNAGSDVLPVILPANINLTGSFVPVSDSPWLTIANTNNGVVSFSFTANLGPNATNQIAHITLLGQSITVTQAAPTYVLSTNAFVETNAAGAANLSLTVNPSIATWTAVSNVTWLHVNPANQSGTGSATVAFTFDANPWATNRIGTLTVAGQIVTVTQMALPVTSPILTGLQLTASGALQFSFTNNAAASFSVWSSTNLTLPFTNWMLVGSVTNEGGGQFQFATPPASNSMQEFYRVSSP